MNRTAAPVIVGARRNGAQRYASTTAVTMRRVKSRAVAAVVGIALTVATLTVALSGSPTVSSACADIAAGTDADIPADIAAICHQ